MNGTESSHVDDVQALISQIQAIDASEIVQNPGAKSEILALAKKLTNALEEPLNRATDLVFKPYISIAARIAVDLDLFKRISTSHETVTSDQLALETGGEKVLISRILRLLAAVDFVEQPRQDAWSANETTKAMALAPIAAGHRFVYVAAPALYSS